MATWDPEPRAPHLKAWLEQTSALGEEGELPGGGPWPQVVDSLLFLVKSPQLLGLLGAGHWSFPIVPSTASPISGTPAASTSFVPRLSTSEIYLCFSLAPSPTLFHWLSSSSQVGTRAGLGGQDAHVGKEGMMDESLPSCFLAEL